MDISLFPVNRLSFVTPLQKELNHRSFLFSKKQFRSITMHNAHTFYKYYISFSHVC
jgi:hypothetical protein